jgi:phosphopantetheinyl transferase
MADPVEVYCWSSAQIPVQPDPEVLTEAQRRQLAEFRTQARREEYLAGKTLLHAGLQRLPPGGWRTSLSHTGGLMACAAALHMQPGIDVEPLGRQIQPRYLRMSFSPREHAAWFSRADADQTLRAWTLKEAFRKTCGDPLPPFRELEVLFPEGGPPQLHWHGIRFTAALDLAPGYLASLALPAPAGTDVAIYLLAA